MDDENVSRFNFGQVDIFHQEVALEAKWACDIISLTLSLVILDDAILGGNRVSVTPLSRMINFTDELNKSNKN